MKAIYNEYWKAKKIEVTEHSPMLFDAEIDLYSKYGEKRLICKGCRDIRHLLEAFYSNRIEIEENENFQLEFGRFKLCFSSDSYFEVDFDEIYEIDTVKK